jgi:lipase chaperone LimK
MNSQEIQELAGHRKVPAWVVKLVGDAVAIERAACAKLFESYETFGEDYDSYYADKYKAMIIARGNNDV